MNCTYRYSPYEDEDGCASSARAAPGSSPFLLGYVFYSTVGVLALGFVFVPLHVKSYRGR